MKIFKITFFLLLLFFSTTSNCQVSDTLFIDSTYKNEDLDEVTISTDKTVTDTVESSVATKVKGYFKDADDDTSIIQPNYKISQQIEDYKKDKDFKYPKRFFEKKEIEVDTTEAAPVMPHNPINFSMLEIIFWVVIVAFIVVMVALYFKDNNLKIRNYNSKDDKANNDELNFDDIFSIDYNRQIDIAEKNLNYNLATRLRFLYLLTKLDNKKLIQYGLEKTNFDYQFQLINTKFYQPFVNAAVLYDYAWYSEIIVSQNQYNQITEEFKKLDYLL